MICKNCQKNVATVHVTEVLEPQDPESGDDTPVVEEQHLCEVCAQAGQLPHASPAPNTMADIWKKLRRLLAEQCLLLRSFAQQDAAEFLRILLDNVHEELNRVDCPPAYRELPSQGQVSQVTNAWWQYYEQCSASSLTDLFRGQLLSIVSCEQCGQRSLSADCFLQLALPLPSERRASVARCFREFTRRRRLKDYQCGQCANQATCSQRLGVYRCPQVLSIQLKRFSHKGKLHTLVQVPQRLKLVDLEGAVHAYRLCALVHHIGNADFGHYTAECLQEAEAIIIDDACVKRQAYHDQSATAYLLFYTTDRSN